MKFTKTLTKIAMIAVMLISLHLSVKAFSLGKKLPADIRISGQVRDSATGQRLVGVTVQVKGSHIGTTTNSSGNFSLNVTDNAILEISYLGYNKMEIPVNGQSVINVSLTPSSTGLNQVVVIGYGTQSKIKMTSAVSSIDSREIQLIPTSNLSNILAGRLSGTFVTSQTGTPGIGSSIRVRARSSFSGNYDPAYVIDGVVRDKTSFDALDPNEVSSVTVLKDAASAAIYGSRSSNGVILVTTKTGQSGKPVIEYNTTVSTQRTGKFPEYMPVKDALNLWKSILGNLSDDEINWVLTHNPKGENYYNAAYTNPTSQHHALSVSGGNDKVTYYMGGSYYHEDGFLPNVWYKKYNLRGNIQAHLVKNLTLGLNVSNSYGTRNRFNFTYDYGSLDLNNLWGKLLYWDVFSTPYINGKPNDPGWLGNPIEMMRNGGYWRNENQQLDALLTGEYKVPFINGLTLKMSYSKNIDNSFTKDYAKKQTLYEFKKTGANSLIYTDTITGTLLSRDPGTQYLGNQFSKSNSYQLNAQINYDRTFGKHTVSALAGYEQYEYNSNYFSLYRYNFPLFPTDQFFATSANNSDWSTGGNEGQDGRLSYIGRVNYDYNAKYLFSASVRRDGSVRFAPNERWGWFPSVSAGWVLSKEDFFQASSIGSSINFLKLRASLATTGNDVLKINNQEFKWAWLDQYNIQNSTYYLGNSGVAAPRLAYGGIPNPNLKWERSQTADIGLEATAFENISLTFDYWTRQTSDILGYRILAIPYEFGSSLPAENYGKVNSHGIEVELNYDNRIGKDFSYHIKGIFSYATNKVIKEDVAANAQPYADPNGKTLSYGYGYKALGVIKTQADLDKLPAGYTINGVAPALGDMLLADISGPGGKPDNTVNGYDQIVLGNYFGANNAPYSYGLDLSLSYKGFSVETLLSALTGFKVSYNDAWGRNFGGGGKVPEYHADSWSPNNPNGSTPELYPWGNPHSYGYTWTSTFNVYDGDFVRMKYLNLNYLIPPSITGKLSIAEARIFVSATNLFYLSKFKFYDPELYQFMSYPTMKTFSVGVDVRFSK